ncbi:hypothetical protein [Spelaeicoccus albus]|uniref:Lipoprotein n=1 Tax=Spelaeicoccus albus TaxID=1280376 RepID=A0A7Z0AA00_9MICO|nr:hypothetical protein [Spelaeicoccus albus]NYI66331.1 hypothetical protein [Spelaeicoccus albus]
MNTHAPAVRSRTRAAGAVLCCVALAAALTGCSVAVSTDPDQRGVHVRLADDDEPMATPTADPVPDGRRIRAKLPVGPPVTVIKPKGWTRGGHILDKESLFGHPGDGGALQSVSIEAATDDYWSDPAGKLADFRRSERHAESKRIIGARRATIGHLAMQRFSEIWSAETSGKMYVVEIMVALKYHGTLHTVTVRGSTQADQPRKLIDAVVRSVKVDGIPIAAAMKN